MNKMQQQVREFHQKFGIAPYSRPGIIDDEELLFRSHLIVGEVSEFITASAYGDLLLIIDAMCDLMYVTIGTAEIMGIDLEPFFDEVHRSNMTKRGKDKVGRVEKGPDFSPPDLQKIWDEQSEIK